MADKNYEIPSPSEKQSYKFLLDAALARKRMQAGMGAEEEVELLVEAEIEVEESGPCEPVEIEQLELEAMEDSEEGTDDAPAAPRAALELTPGKNYFRIGEVAELLSVEPHVLRYWESEFSHIRPTKSGGQRVYNRKTVEALHQIRHLLYDEGFSISGARKRLKEERREKKAAPIVQAEATVPTERLIEIEKDLRDLIRFAEMA